MTEAERIEADILSYEKLKRKEKRRRYREQNYEAILAANRTSQRNWYAEAKKDPEKYAKIKEKNHQYYQDHKEELKESAKQYHKLHKDEIHERQRKYYWEHRDELIAYQRERRKKNRSDICGSGM